MERTMAETTQRSGGGVLASFDYLDSTVDAIHELRKAGYKDLRAYMPYPEHHIEEALGYHESPVRVWTLVGGLTGAAAGFGFSHGMASSRAAILATLFMLRAVPAATAGSFSLVEPMPSP